LIEGALLAVCWIGGLSPRQRLMQWGSAASERQADLPGDDLVPHPTHCTTRAISIQAPADVIWPWLVQMGQDRAGFYTHNWVERFLRSGIPDVHVLHPEWQTLRVSDLLRTNRELRPGHPLGWTVELVAPGRALVLRSKSLPAGTYAYVLQSLPDGATRLVIRDRAVWKWWQAPFRALVFEPLHAYMQTGQLQGIKERAASRMG
jgi:hypothetical protein